MPTVIIANPVNEKQSGRLTVSHYDTAGALTVPSTIRYRIDDPDARQQVRDWTTVTPASSYTIILTRTDNTMIDATKGKERRKVTVEAVYSSDEADPSDCVYEISKLQFYP